MSSRLQCAVLHRDRARTKLESVDKPKGDNGGWKISLLGNQLNYSGNGRLQFSDDFRKVGHHQTKTAASAATAIAGADHSAAHSDLAKRSVGYAQLCMRSFYAWSGQLPPAARAA
jgi:hypothetical protein